METPTTTRLKEIGPWSEQFSSSGKRYYYNRETEVSQWEKPTEWKQAEREQAEKASSSLGIAKDNEKSASDKHRQKQTSTPTSNTPGSGSAKQLDSSTGQNLSASSNSAKRTRLNEITSSSSPSSQNRNKPTTSQSQPLISSSEFHQNDSKQDSRDRDYQRTGVTTSTSQPNQRPTSFSPSAKRPFASSIHGEDFAKPAVQTVKTGQNDGTDQKRQTTELPNFTNSTTFQQQKSPMKNGSSSGTNISPRPFRNLNKSDEQAIEVELLADCCIKFGFREEKYARFYHPDLSGSSSKRGLISEAYLNDLKKCADRNAKHTNSLFLIDRDLYSIQTLMKTAEFRSQLLKQRIGSTQKRIQELETKGQ